MVDLDPGHSLSWLLDNRKQLGLNPIALGYMNPVYPKDILSMSCRGFFGACVVAKDWEMAWQQAIR